MVAPQIALVVRGQRVAWQALAVAPDVGKRAAASRVASESKRRWVEEHLQCVLCRTVDGFEVGEESDVCLGCGARFNKTPGDRYDPARASKRIPYRPDRECVLAWL